MARTALVTHFLPHPTGRTSRFDNPSRLCLGASLGHKANHASPPENNCIYYRYDSHPVFGRIKCLRSVRGIKRGEELLVDYGYEAHDAPAWWIPSGSSSLKRKADSARSSTANRDAEPASAQEHGAQAGDGGSAKKAKKKGAGRTEGERVAALLPRPDLGRPMAKTETISASLQNRESTEQKSLMNSKHRRNAHLLYTYRQGWSHPHRGYLAHSRSRQFPDRSPSKFSKIGGEMAPSVPFPRAGTGLHLLTHGYLLI